MGGRARAEKIPIEALFQQIDVTNIFWGGAVWGPKVSFILGTDGATKSDDFSEKFQTAFHDQKALFKVPKICNINFLNENDPPPPWHFSENSSDLVA